MTHTQMRVDVAPREFSFGFAPGYSGAFLKWDEAVDGDSFLHTLCEEASAMATMPEIWPRGVSSKSTMDEFPELFSSTLGTAKGVRVGNRSVKRHSCAFPAVPLWAP